jgi:hypothetical protein
VNIPVARQSRAVQGWVVTVQGKPCPQVFKSKREAIQEAKAIFESCKIAVQPFVRLRLPDGTRKTAHL